MIIKVRVATISDSKIANDFLTKLIVDEKKHDDNINEKCIVSRLYEDIIPYDNNIVFIAEVDKKPVGYLYGFIINNGDAYINKVAKLEALFVDKNYRNNGVATKLVNRFKKWAKGKDIKYVEVQICNENIDALKLYSKCNFSEFKSTLINDLSGDVK